MTSVLVIDDDAGLLELTSDDLALAGFEVRSATRGIEALQLIRDNPPEIIVCDVNMPEMNGYDVLAALRDDSVTAHVPFIFLTALSDHTDIREGMERGADDYLIKPVEIGKLIQAIHTRLARQATFQMSRLREFAHRLVMTQEMERRSFALTLKDNLADQLSDLKISLEMLSRLSGMGQTGTLQAASQLANDTLQTVNALSYAMWPSVLTRLGLEAALLSLFDGLQENSEFQIAFEYNDLEKVTDPEAVILLYRIIQEALTNTRHHAGTNFVSLKLWVEENRLRLQIEDEGRGFDVQAALNAADKIGLLSMLERAFLLNGELNIISSPREGTRIYGSFPLLMNSTSSPAHFSPISTTSTRQTPENNAATRDAENRVRILIADPNELSRWGYKAIVETATRFAVISELADWSTTLRFLEDLSVDILVISHALIDEQGGLLSLQQLHDLYPNMHILLLSHYTEYTFAAQALKNGVAGYLLKTCGREEVLEALNTLAEGKQYVAKEIVDTRQRGQTSIKSNSSIDAFSTLTEREREIFYRVVNGQTNQEIADELVISARTVEAHRFNMMRKLGLTGVPMLINYAIHKGLVGKDI